MEEQLSIYKDAVVRSLIVLIVRSAPVAPLFTANAADLSYPVCSSIVNSQCCSMYALY